MLKRITGLALALALITGVAIAEAPEGMELVFEEDFENGIDRWEPTDRKAWRIEEEDGNKFVSLFQKSDYEYIVRSPHSINWAKGVDVGSFVLDIRMRQTGKEYGHRDLCLFFNKQDASHFYYVHMATKADEHANSIFLVNGEPRVSIAQERTKGTDWGKNTGWHDVRIKRDIESGEILVYFDDMETPIMKTVDKTFTSGPIGIGSFDDVGDFDNIKLYVPKK